MLVCGIVKRVPENEKRKKDKVRNEGACGWLPNLLNKYNNVQGTFLTITHTLTLGRTGEAPAKLEVHTLHAHGEHEFVDSADHLVPITYDANLARLRALLGRVWVCDAAHQSITINYKCRGICRPLNGSHVNLHTGGPNAEFFHAGRHRHEGTCERKEEEGEE